jgi:nitrogen regulatory protein PII
MTLVTAVVEPFKLDGVRAALLTLGAPGLTVSKSSGDGRQRGHTEVYRGAEHGGAASQSSVCKCRSAWRCGGRR